MNVIDKRYQLYNVLSLDVVAGSVSSSYFFVKLTHGNVSVVVMIMLALTVWVIYTTDHLIDARKVPTIASSTRHYFHQQYYKILLKFVIIATLLNTMLLFLLERRQLLIGCILAFFVLIYFIVKQVLPLLKEFLTATLYTSGILLPVISNSDFHLRDMPFQILMLFFILCLINLLVFSYIDMDSDAVDGHRSGVIVLGKKRSTWIIYILFGCASILVFFSENISAGFIVWFCAFIMMLLFAFSSWSKMNDRYRIIGDGIFLLLGIYSVIWM